MCYSDEIENSEESEYFSPSTPGGGGNNSNYRYQRAATPNGRERKRVLRYVILEKISQLRTFTSLAKSTKIYLF